MSKCSLLYFVVGVTVTTASYAFFGQMMQMPQQMMGSMMVMGADKPCDCSCPQLK